AFLAMYPGLRDVIAAGVRFQQLIDAGLERGLWDMQGLTQAEWRNALLEQRRDAVKSSSVLRFSDGRCFLHREVGVAEGGTVVTCSDSTEHEKRRDELQATAERSGQLLFDLQRTIDAVEMGIVVIDA